MSIYLGSTEITGLKLGSSDVQEVYLGSQKIWPESIPALVDASVDTFAVYVVSGGAQIPTVGRLPVYVVSGGAQIPTVGRLPVYVITED